jgi:transglutaminase-like putative cysteine protease
MSLMHVGCELHYSVTGPSSFLFNVAVARTAHQTVRHEVLTLNPSYEYVVNDVGSEGNRVLRFQAKAGTLTLRYQATVGLQPDIDDPPTIRESEHHELPSEVLPYLNPSRYCESDRLLRLALKEFGNVAPGYSRVAAICDWTHARLDYLAGSTDARTSACDVLVQRAGVCRDYAHLAITLCRALCIPARYVSGYAVGLTPPDFHGFFEAYLGSRWYLFDATRMTPRRCVVRHHHRSGHATTDDRIGRGLDR